MSERLEQMAFGPLEAAKATGQSRGKIFKDIREKRLRAVKSGSRTLILRGDLEAYCATFLPAHLSPPRQPLMLPGEKKKPRHERGTLARGLKDIDYALVQ